MAVRLGIGVSFSGLTDRREALYERISSAEPILSASEGSGLRSSKRRDDGRRGYVDCQLFLQFLGLPVECRGFACMKPV